MPNQIETDDSQQGAVRVEGTDKPSTSGSAYKMDHPNRGKALIFNHFEFKNNRLQARGGTYKDCEDLKGVLKKIGFNVEVHHDLTSVDFEKTLEKARDEDHTDSDCILIAIMSHGGKNYIETFDIELKLDDILKTIDSSKTLKKKPKIFIIQACRGNWEQLQDDSSGSAWGGPTSRDWIVGLATVSGHVAYRRLEIGSFFIQALVKVFGENHETDDIGKLLTSVNKEVRDADIGKLIQTSTFQSTLTRVLYLKSTDEPHPTNRSMEGKVLKFFLSIAQNNVRNGDDH